MILNFAKDQIVIFTQHRTGLKELKAARLFKLEEDHHCIMAMKTFAINVVCMIGLTNTGEITWN